jgi:hypothetical protein
MRSKRWLHICLAVIFSLSGRALADKHGHGKHDNDDDQGRQYYSQHDRDEMRGWYHGQDDDRLPPGLAKKDQLPPGLEKATTSAWNSTPRIAQEDDAVSGGIGAASAAASRGLPELCHWRPRRTRESAHLFGAGYLSLGTVEKLQEGGFCPAI